MIRRAAGVGLALALLTVLSWPTAMVGATGQAGTAQAGTAQVELVEQSPLAARGSTVAIRVKLSGVPPDASLRLVVHQRVRSRSELDASMRGDDLRSRILNRVTPLSALPSDADGARRVELSLDPAAGGLSLAAEGVYPLELISQEADGARIAALVTHLIVPPSSGDTSPALGVAVVAEIGAPPALQPDGSLRLERSDVESLDALITGLGAAPGVPATIAATPETLEALSESPTPGDAELANDLRGAADGRMVLDAPYVPISPDGLFRGGLPQEISAQLARGHAVLADSLGTEPDRGVALAPDDLGADGLDVLAVNGVPRVLVTDGQVAPLDPGVIAYSLAQPFQLIAPDDGTNPPRPATPLTALATDPVVLERATSAGSPALTANRVLSELAMLRLEQPSVARSVALPMGSGTRARVMTLVLRGLAAGEPFLPLTLDEAFEHADPLLDASGAPVERPLLATPAAQPSPPAVLAVTEARGAQSSFVDLIGSDNPRNDPLARHLLLATTTALSATQRAAHVDAVTAAIAAVESSVSAPATFTLTLTARDGTIPLTLTNGSGIPLHVSVRLRSSKLEFPAGDTIERTLAGPTTRIDLTVRARATGAFPVVVEVATPDGARTLTTTRYTVRSTAISGVGLVLSGGAGLFLVVWWARHWRRTRRSAKLVARQDHPAVGGG